MLYNVYQGLMYVDLILIVLALVVRLSGRYHPAISLTLSVLSIPFSVLLAANSGLLEMVTTAWDPSNSSFVTDTYTYTGNLYLTPIWIGLFFVGFMMTVAFSFEMIAYRRKEREEHEFDL